MMKCVTLLQQRNNFNLVSILDGGFPSLVETLLSSRGSVEPVIVDFNPGVEYEKVMRRVKLF